MMAPPTPTTTPIMMLRVDADMPDVLLPPSEDDRLPVGVVVVLVVTAVVEPSDCVKVVTKVLVETGCVVDVVEAGGVVVLSVGELVVLSVGDELGDDVVVLSWEVVGGVVDVVGGVSLVVGEGVLVVGVVSLVADVGVGVVDVLAGVEVAWADGCALEVGVSLPVALAAPLEAALLSARRTAAWLAWAAWATRKKLASSRSA